MLTKAQIEQLRQNIEEYAEAYEENKNAGRLMPYDANIARAEYRAVKAELDSFLKSLIK